MLYLIVNMSVGKILYQSKLSQGNHTFGGKIFMDQLAHSFLYEHNLRRNVSHVQLVKLGILFFYCLVIYVGN